MAFKLDENLKEAFLKHRRGGYDKKLDGRIEYHVYQVSWYQSLSQCNFYNNQ